MTEAGRNKLTLLIKDKARELGFDLCGIARAQILEDNARVLKAWCEAGMNDKMGYLHRNIEKRADPGSLMKDAKSLIVTGISYYSEYSQKKPLVPVLSRYAYGRDYHNVIIPKLNTLLGFIREEVPEADGRAISDSAPIFEKPWASEAGLGWQGKHSIFINKDTGSFIFLGILILNLELEYDKPYRKEHCGSCRLCIDMCPTGAINDNRTIDARKCIANLTIEGRGPLPEDLMPKFERRVYGCDKCQEVCPWNSHPKPGAQEFKISREISEMTPEDWQAMTSEDFERIFSDSPVERVGYERLKENIAALTGQK
jgi:epoxyqueuosine reductase